MTHLSQCSYQLTLNRNPKSIEVHQDQSHADALIIKLPFIFCTRPKVSSNKPQPIGLADRNLRAWIPVKEIKTGLITNDIVTFFFRYSHSKEWHHCWDALLGWPIWKVRVDITVRKSCENVDSESWCTQNTPGTFRSSRRVHFLI